MNGFVVMVIALAVLAVLASYAPVAQAAEAKESTYRGWDTLELSNGIIEVETLPQIGGRVIQIKLGDFEYLWVNEALVGTMPPESKLGPDDGWLNFGGNKLWPAPQGWGKDGYWDGPPDPVLDTGETTGEIIDAEGADAAVRMTGADDPGKAGIKFSRLVKVFDGTSRIHLDATMTNIGDKPSNWGIWSNTQLEAGNRDGEGYNEDITSYTPMNPDSHYFKGYQVLFGTANNPSYQPDYENNILKVHYKRIIGKVGVDAIAGWSATVDGKNGYAFVQRFNHEKDKEYPNGASVEIWMDGVGDVFVGDDIWHGDEDPAITPYCFESEEISPRAALKPGESYTFSYDWYVCRVGGSYPVLNCTDVGIECEKLSAKVDTGELYLEGRYGVFNVASLGIAFFDANGVEMKSHVSNISVSPAQPVILTSSTGLEVPEKAMSVAVRLHGEGGKLLGELGRTELVR